eukprot:Opistho-1_new@45987
MLESLSSTVAILRSIRNVRQSRWFTLASSHGTTSLGRALRQSAQRPPRAMGFACAVVDASGETADEFEALAAAGCSCGDSGARVGAALRTATLVGRSRVTAIRGSVCERSRTGESSGVFDPCSLRRSHATSFSVSATSFSNCSGGSYIESRRAFSVSSLAVSASSADWMAASPRIELPPARIVSGLRTLWSDIATLDDERGIAAGCRGDFISGPVLKRGLSVRMPGEFGTDSGCDTRRTTGSFSAPAASSSSSLESKSSCGTNVTGGGAGNWDGSTWAVSTAAAVTAATTFCSRSASSRRFRSFASVLRASTSSASNTSGGSYIES